MNESYKILVVDDEEIIIESILEIFSDLNYQTVTASDGVEGIEKFKEFKPDLVLMDVMMPSMNGYDACQAIRNLDHGYDKEVPIIFISAKSDLKDKLRGYEVGGNDYLTKPFDNDELLVKIDLTFQEREQVRALQNSVKDSNAMAYSLMNSASKMGAVGRFLRKTLTCNTLDELLQSFFNLSLSGELGCTIKTNFDGKTIILSDDGIEHSIDFEIIRKYNTDERIFYFGKNRAIFNWGNITMLVRNVGDEVDNIAIMLDGLSAGVQFMQMQSILLKSIHTFQQKNAQLKTKASTAAENLKDEIRNAFTEMGSGTSLTEADENRISYIVDKNRNLLDEILLSGKHLETELEQALSAYNNRV